MPWEVRESGSGEDRYCVHKIADGSVVACHPTQEAADAHVRALYASEPAAAKGDAAPRRVFRVDVGSLGKAERTPQGGVRAPAHPTRACVAEYEQEDGSILREYRPPQEVLDPASLASLRDAPLTLEHTMVTPENFAELAIGHVSGEPRADGDKAACVVVVQRKDAVDGLLGRRLGELSCGYECELDMTPGETPDGQRYDAVQRKIRHNHLMLLPPNGARLGPTMRVHMDAKENAVKTIKIGGIDYPADSDAAAQAAAQLEAGLGRERTRADAATGQLDAQAARIAELEARVAASERADAERAVEALRQRVKPLTGDADLSALTTERAVMERAILAVDPKAKLEGQEEVYLRSRLDAHLAAQAKRPQRTIAAQQLDSATSAARSAPPSAQTPPTPAVHLDADGSGHGAQAAWDAMVRKYPKTTAPRAGDRS